MLAAISSVAGASFIPSVFKPLPADQLLQIAPFGFLVVVALAVDLVFGQAGWIAKMPSLHDTARRLGIAAAKKLDRARRSDSDRAMRGMIFSLLMIVAGFLCGGYLWHMAGMYDLVVIMIGVLVAQIIGIGGTMDQLRSLIGKPSLSPKAAASTVLTLSENLLDRLITGVMIGIFLGPAGLLAWVGLLGIIGAGSGKDCSAPAGPFYMFPVLLYRLIVWLPSMMARVIIALSTVLFRARRKATQTKSQLISTDRLIPRSQSAATLCNALGIRINLAGSQSDTGNNAVDWVGHQSGRRAITHKDLKNALTIAWIITIICALTPVFLISYYGPIIFG